VAQVRGIVCLTLIYPLVSIRITCLHAFLFSFVFWVAAFLFNSFNMIRNHSSDISTFSFVERGLSPVCFLFGNRGFPFLFLKKDILLQDLMTTAGKKTTLYYFLFE